jgi:hypothetical protein
MSAKHAASNRLVDETAERESDVSKKAASADAALD